MASEQEIIAAQAAEIERLKNKAASLEDQLCWLRKKMFGKMSEKNLPLDPAALGEPGLFDEPPTDEERAELDAAVRKEEEEATRLIQVKGFERKPRKAIDTAGLEVREEHIYPEVENREDYTELDPEVTDTLVLVPAQIYVRRTVRHKLVLKSNLQIKDPDRKPFELYTLTFPHTSVRPLSLSDFDLCLRFNFFLIFSSGRHEARQASGHVVAVLCRLQPF